MGIQQFSSGLTPFNQQQMDTIQAKVSDNNTGINDLKNSVVSKAGSAELSLTNAAASTWYTLLNITGKGKLHKVRTYYTSAGSADVRVTVDGVLYDVAYAANARYDAGYGEYLALVDFKTSLKVEIWCTNASSLSGVADYALV